MSRGASGTVVDVRVFNRHGIEKDERSITIERAEIEQVQQDKLVEEEILERSIKQRASQILSGSSLTKKVKDLSCLLYTSPSPRDVEESRMPSSA